MQALESSHSSPHDIVSSTRGALKPSTGSIDAPWSLSEGLHDHRATSSFEGAQCRALGITLSETGSALLLKDMLSASSSTVRKVTPEVLHSSP
jgi:hypothetical protein